MGEYKELINNLKEKHYNVNCFNNQNEAKEYLKSKIYNKTIGFGDSITLNEMKLHSLLNKNNTINNPMISKNNNEFIEIAKKANNSEIFILSVNALTQKGEMVNLDGTGNRIAGSLFNHKKVYFIIGTNKIVDNLEQAIDRVRNHCAPNNAKRLNLKTPCAIKGDRCYDCKSKDRICNGMMIYLNKMQDIEMEILLIDENLGY